MPDYVRAGQFSRASSAGACSKISQHRKLILGGVALNVGVLLFVTFVVLVNRSSYEDASRSQSRYEDTSRNQSSYEDASRNQSSDEEASRNQSSDEEASRNQSSYEDAYRNQSSYEEASRNQSSYEDASRNQSSYEDASPTTTQQENFCISAECNKTAQSFLMSMDMGTSPCEDFFRFACGNWSSVLSTGFNFSKLNPGTNGSVDYALAMLDQDRRKLLRMVAEIKPSDIEALRQLKIFFESCTAIGSHPKVDNQWIGELLNRVFLPGDSIGKTLARINRELGFNFLFSVGLAVNQDNNLRKEMIIDEPQLTSEDLLLVLFPQLRESKLANILNKFEREVDVLTWRLGIAGDIQSAQKIVELDKKLVMVMAGSNNSLEPGNFNHFNLNDLNGLLPTRNFVSLGGSNWEKSRLQQMNWIEYMDTLFDGIPDVSINQDFIVNVKNVDHVRRVGQSLAATQIDQIRMSLIARVLLKLGGEFTDMMDLGEDAMHKVCIMVMEKAMPFATAHKLVMGNAREGKANQVQEIFDYVSVAFNSTISSLDWMSSFRKSLAMRKVANIKTHISYPHWLLNSSKVNEHYEGLNFARNGKGAPFAQNGVTFRKWGTEKVLKEFHRPVSSDHLWEYIGSSPATVNLFYLVEHNAIVIPDGYLRFPNFGSGIKSIDFGSLGSALGHEIAHGFDSDGRKRDESGKLSSWWHIVGEESFKSTTQCFIDQYEGYWTPEMGFTGSSKPGAQSHRNLTLNEDISDNWGLRAGFEAYLMYRNSSGAQEKILPGLEEYSSEQLFFLSFAHSHCTYNEQSGERSWLRASHSPNWMRVVGPLSNYEEFSRVWQCPVGSGMNPEKKCDLWG